MVVYLYTFSKRENSTALPSGGTSYTGTLRSPCGMLNPSIGFDFGQLTAPSYNYAYSGDFGRYYWITEWTWEAGIWWATMRVDVLASWRSAIGNSTEYVLRSASLYNGSVIDNLYPVTNSHSYSYELINSVWTGTGPGSGYYVVGIVSGDTAAIGATAYYVFTPSNFRLFMEALLGSVSYTGIDFTSGEISEAFFKSLYNPFQYIVSCMWVPLTPPMGATVSAVPVGWWSIDASASLLSGSYMNTNYEVTIPKHPQAASRGTYLNGAPFSRYVLYHEPYGVIEIDPNMLTNASTLYINQFVDAVTGVGELRIGSLDSIDFCAGATAQVGVPIQLAQISQDLLSGASGLVSGVSNVAGSLASSLTGGLIGGGSIAGAISGIASAVESLVPHVSSAGANGAFAGFTQAIFLFADFWEVVDEDRTHRGRPYCASVQISNLSGYVLCADPDISFSGTADEIQRVREYMASGFYWE